MGSLGRMRFRTALTIGYGEPARIQDVRFTELNDDCLLMICEQLSLVDQLRLIELDEERLKHLVLRIWKRKYWKSFDWRKEPEIKLLSDKEQSQLLDYLGRITRSLLHLPGEDPCCRKWLHRKRKHKLNNLIKITFSETSSLILQPLPLICPNLVYLKLGQAEGVTTSDLRLLFLELKQLQTFELRNFHGTLKTPLGFGHNLESLKLPASLLRTTAAEIFQLPKLRQLTGFLGRASQPDDDKANASGMEILSTCLRHLRGRNCQIVGLRLQCQLDGNLPDARGSELELFRLQRFAWHSQLTVHYDVADGSIKWLPQRPQVLVHSLLPFIVTQSSSLRQLDFTRNLHATPTFLTQLNAQLLRAGISVWHDACPPQLTDADADTRGHGVADADADRDTDTDTAETNDLALVELELLHLPNEQRKRIPER